MKCDLCKQDQCHKHPIEAVKIKLRRYQELHYLCKPCLELARVSEDYLAFSALTFYSEWKENAIKKFGLEAVERFEKEIKNRKFREVIRVLADIIEYLENSTSNESDQTVLIYDKQKVKNELKQCKEMVRRW